MAGKGDPRYEEPFENGPPAGRARLPHYLRTPTIPRTTLNGAASNPQDVTAIGGFN